MIKGFSEGMQLFHITIFKFWLVKAARISMKMKTLKLRIHNKEVTHNFLYQMSLLWFSLFKMHMEVSSPRFFSSKGVILLFLINYQKRNYHIMVGIVVEIKCALRWPPILRQMFHTCYCGFFDNYLWALNQIKKGKRLIKSRFLR
jgi:hypothetical protein